MDTPINRSFTPHAHALILLRQDGYPCVFFGDLYGLGAPYPEPPTCWGKLPGLILVRNLYAYGRQEDYFERPDCIGWVRHGTQDRSDGLAVIMSWSQNTDQLNPSISMNVGKQHAGETWTDVLGWEWAVAVIDEDGVGKFPCQWNGMACFVNGKARGREKFPVNFNSDFRSLVH
jgi:alpha-amylase